MPPDNQKLSLFWPLFPISKWRSIDKNDHGVAWWWQCAMYHCNKMLVDTWRFRCILTNDCIPGELPLCTELNHNFHKKKIIEKAFVNRISSIPNKYTYHVPVNTIYWARYNGNWMMAILTNPIVGPSNSFESMRYEVYQFTSQHDLPHHFAKSVLSMPYGQQRRIGTHLEQWSRPFPNLWSIGSTCMSDSSRQDPPRANAGWW